MPRINFYVDVNDEEFTNFMSKMGARAVAANGDGEESGDTPADAGTLDANGVPWIEAVHASTKGLTKEKLWRGKKGVTPEQRVSVENAWKQAQATQQQPAFTPPAFLTGGAAAMPGLPGMPIPVADVPVSYTDLVSKYQALAAAGKISAEQATAIYAATGVTDVNALQTNESLRKAVMAELNKLG